MREVKLAAEVTCKQCAFEWRPLLMQQLLGHPKGDVWWYCCPRCGLEEPYAGRLVTD